MALLNLPVRQQLNPVRSKIAMLDLHRASVGAGPSANSVPALSAASQRPIPPQNIDPAVEIGGFDAAPFSIGQGSERYFASNLDIEVGKFRLKQELSKFTMHLDSNWRADLYRQLDEIFCEDEIDEDDTTAPDVASWTTLIRLVVYLRIKRCPGLGMAGRNMVLSWFRDRTRITLTCLPRDRVYWVASRFSGDQLEPAAGESTIRGLPDFLEPFHVRSWLFDDRPDAT